MQDLILQGMQQKWQKSCSRCNKNTWHFESNCILQPPNTCFSLLIDLDTLTTMSPKIDAPYLWIRPLCLVRFSLRATINHHGPSMHSGHILHLSIAAKQQQQQQHSVATTTQLRSLKVLIAKTPLLHMLYLMDWLIYGVSARTGGWEFDHSHIAGTSSPSYEQQVEE